MLVLSRRVGDAILVPGSDLSFAVLEIRGDKVLVGVSAPQNVAVYRQEVWERIKRETVDITTESRADALNSSN